MTKEYIRKIALICGIIFVSVLMVGQMVLADQQGWGQKFQCDEGKCPRFRLVLDGEAVLDKETKLVWEASPSTEKISWFHALDRCIELEKGGRKGWHLPTAEQLASLVDTSQEDPALPSGHPFSNVQSDWYWSATTYADGIASAWPLDFDDGRLDPDSKTNNNYYWCVRGGQSYDAY